MDEETDMEIDDSQPGKEEEQDEEGDGAYDESREATSLQRPPSALFPHASGELPFFKSLPEFPAVSNIAIIEEAFHRVKEASYALGYWTAVYQMHAHHVFPPHFPLFSSINDSSRAKPQMITL